MTSISGGSTPCRTESSPGSRRSRPASYLTGGTAASRAYLHHRFSDDLDFFVNDDDRFGLWAQRVVQALARSGECRVLVVHRETRFVRLTVTEADIVLKIEMVNDVPAHVGELRRDSVLGLLDSPENILASTLTVRGRSQGAAGPRRHLGIPLPAGLVM